MTTDEDPLTPCVKMLKTVHSFEPASGSDAASSSAPLGQIPDCPLAPSPSTTNSEMEISDRDNATFGSEDPSVLTSVPTLQLGPSDTTSTDPTDDSAATLTAPNSSEFESPASMGLNHRTWMHWLPEAASMTISLSSFIVIIAILVSYDDRPLPSLPFKITLNALISFFSTVTKAAFMIPIAACISQLKWNWFRKHARPLDDFELLDASSRGAWGSFGLICHVKWRHPVSIAALVTILGLISSFITQLLISYPTRLAVTDRTVMVQAVQNFGLDPKVADESTFQDPSDGYYTAAQFGVIDGYLNPVAPLSPLCPTSNCTFPVFDSMGICYQMADITEHLEVREVDPRVASPDDSTVMDSRFYLNGSTEYNVSLPYGVYMVTQDVVSLVISPLLAEQMSKSIAFESDADLMRTHIVSMVGIFTDPETWAPDGNLTSRFYAFEIMFHMCVQTYNVTVTNANATTDVFASSYAVSPSSPRTPDARLNVTCSMMSYQNTHANICGFRLFFGEGTKLYLENPRKPNSAAVEDYFATDYGTMNLLTNVIESVFGAIIAADKRVTDKQGGVLLAGYLTGGLVPLFTYSVKSSRDVVYSAIETVARSLATSLTNKMRTTIPVANYSSNGFNITGTAMAMETYVAVSWGWLAFLATQLVLAMVVMMITIIDTGRLRTRIVKTSAIATLIALDDGARAKAGALSDSREMRKMAAGVRVQLKENVLSLAEK